MPGDAVAATLSVDAQPLRLAAREALFARGDPTDGLYFVLSGAISIETTEPVARLEAGECFGEVGLLAQAPRSATARALVASDLLHLPAAAVTAAWAATPALKAALEALVEARLRPLRTGLTTVFGPLDEATLLALQAVAETVRIPGGAVLMRPGDAAEALFIVRAGRLAVHSPAGALLAELTAGQPVGESALLTGAPRGATVIALRDAVLTRLPHDAVQRVLRHHPGAALSMLQTVARRMSSPPVTQPPPRVITVLPGHGRADIEALRAAVEAHLPGSLWIDAARFERIHGPGAAASAPAARMVRWLVDQERLHAQVIFCADATDTPWTRRCLRQSDRVVRVVDADAEVTPWPIADRGADLLVLRHPADREFPRGVAPWLDAHLGAQHLHLRAGHAGDGGRAARFIAGRPLGVVLGGGGARGFAHIGALLALREMGIEADIICGASIGAILAGVYAMEGDLERTAEATVRVGRRLRRALTVPIASVLHTRRLDREFEAATRGLAVEETWRPFFALSTNLTRYTMHIADRGPMWRALHASCALPAILPPGLADGEVLVDGGLLDNLPVGEMRARCAGPVLAVDVGVGEGLRADTALTRVPSGWRLLWRRVWPFARTIEVPNLLSTITHSLVCSSVQARRRGAEAADLLLRPAVEGVGLMDFRQREALIEAGKMCVQAQAEALAALR